jgi:thioredoxin-dependent peroxiredoxin
MNQDTVRFFMVCAAVALGASCESTSNAPKPATQVAASQPAPKMGAGGAAAAPTPAAAPAVTAAIPAAPEVKAVVLKVGDPAPQLTLALHDGTSVSLASLKGQPVALYFYPKDDTPGCTVEAQGIRDQWADFQKAGIKVYGVSMQDTASHQSFVAKHKLPFPLVVQAQPVAAAFGVPVTGGEYAERQTFLIGADGNIKAIWRTVDPAKHAGDLLAAAAKP